MILVWSAVAGVPCGFVPPPPGPVIPVLAQHDGTAELAVRDAFGTFDTFETDHFAVKWGPDLQPSDEHLALLGADLEEVWERQVVDLGWLPPSGSDAFKLNVYLASTGGSAPEIDFSGGYVWTDDAGYPFIALSTDSLDGYDFDNPWFSPADLVAHEFNHTLQIRNSAFSEGRYGPFFWEATASWSVPQTFDGNPHRGWGNFLLHPHVSLDMWALGGDDASREGRQYDTALFVHYLTEQRGLGGDFIRDAWTNALPSDEPLDYLDRTLEGGLRPVYTDFALSYALQDHDLAQIYLEGMDESVGWGTPDNRTTVRVPSLGTDDLERPPNRLRPQAYAWNHVLWRAGGDGAVTVRFEADDAGTRSTPSDLQAFVAHRSGETLTLVELDTPISVLPDDSVELVVVSTPDGAVPDERFGYQFAFDVDIELPRVAAPNPNTVREGACASAPGVVGWLGLVGLLATRRRIE